MTSKTIRPLATLSAVLLSVLLGACSHGSSGTSDGDYSDAIKAGLARTSATTLCWKVTDNGHFMASLPASMYDTDNEAMRAAIMAHVVVITAMPGDVTVHHLELKNASAWDATNGICVGQRTLVGNVGIKRAGDSSDDTAIVTYTTQLTNIPQWVKDSPDAVAHLQGEGFDAPAKPVVSVVNRPVKGGPLVLQEG